MLCTLFQPDMSLGHKQKTTPQPDTAFFFFKLPRYPIVSGSQTVSGVKNKLKKSGNI